MEKVMYVVSDPEHGSGDGLRDDLLAAVSDLEVAGAERITVDVDDTDADVPAPLPAPEDQPLFRALVSFWLPSYERRTEAEDRLRAVAPRLDGYLVAESLYTDYGENEHAGPRDWSAGTRSPGLLTVTLLTKPDALSYEEWIDHWHGHQSPMSEAMQPRSRYVRNEVVRPVTPDAPPWRAIVEEAWPSAEHVTDPFLFYSAATQEELDANLATMLESVNRLTDLSTLRVATMSEYLMFA